jgi:hypothetical protein
MDGRRTDVRMPRALGPTIGMWAGSVPPQAAHKVMGAGIAASPHFPGLRTLSREGSLCFNRADRSLAILRSPSLRSGCPSKAVKPLRVPLRDCAGHCCPPKSLSHCRAGALHCRTFRESGSGFGLRLRLTLLPLRPFAASRSPGLAAGFTRASPRFQVPAVSGGRSHREARHSHLPPSRTSLRGLWIKRIAGISGAL